MLRVERHVVGDEEVEVPVAIEIRERAAGAPQRRSDAGEARDIGEDAVAAVAVQHVRAEVGDVEIDPAVVVVVARAGAHAVLTMANRRSLGDVVERAVAAIPIQAVPRLPRDRRIGERPAVDQEDVEPPVVVVVEEQPAPPIVSTRCLSALAPLTWRKSIPASRLISVNVTGESSATTPRPTRTMPQSRWSAIVLTAPTRRVTAAPTGRPCMAFSYVSLARAASSMRPTFAYSTASSR